MHPQGNIFLAQQQHTARSQQQEEQQHRRTNLTRVTKQISIWKQPSDTQSTAQSSSSVIIPHTGKRPTLDRAGMFQRLPSTSATTAGTSTAETGARGAMGTAMTSGLFHSMS
jgi:hypothetical protein